MAITRCSCGLMLRHERDFDRGMCPLCYYDGLKEKKAEQLKEDRARDGKPRPQRRVPWSRR
jgi:hypothetical protein